MKAELLPTEAQLSSAPATVHWPPARPCPSAKQAQGHQQFMGTTETLTLQLFAPHWKFPSSYEFARCFELILYAKIIISLCTVKLVFLI